MIVSEAWGKKEQTDEEGLIFNSRIIIHKNELLKRAKIYILNVFTIINEKYIRR